MQLCKVICLLTVLEAVFSAGVIGHPTRHSLQQPLLALRDAYMIWSTLQISSLCAAGQRSRWWYHLDVNFFPLWRKYNKSKQREVGGSGCRQVQYPPASWKGHCTIEQIEWSLLRELSLSSHGLHWCLRGVSCLTGPCNLWRSLAAISAWDWVPASFGRTWSEWQVKDRDTTC